MNFQAELLYNLLPEFHRNRDYYEGEPLRTFLRVFEGPVWEAHRSISQLYADWFIETCEDGAVPLIGELVNQIMAAETLEAIPTQRNLIANAMSDRQRKGTLGALQAVLRDATGWCVRVVEAKDLVAELADLGRAEIARPGTASLRGDAAFLGDSFETHSHRAGLRSDPTETSANYSASTVDVFIWRRRVNRAARSAPGNLGDGKYSFCPIGIDCQLFNVPRHPESRYQIVGPDSVPGPIKRAVLEAELASRRLGEIPATGYFSDPPVISIALRGESGTLHAVHTQQLFACDLSQWLEDASFPNQDSVALDPELGRFQFPRGRGRDVRVSYASRWEPRLRHKRSSKGKALTSIDADCEGNSLSEALKQRPPSLQVNLGESATYGLGEVTIEMKAGETLTIVASQGSRPVLEGQLCVSCAEGMAELAIDDVVFKGSVEVEGGVAQTLNGCTHDPQDGVSSLTGSGQGNLSPKLDASGCAIGPIRWTSSGTVAVDNCILDGCDGPAIQGIADHVGPRLTARHSTVLGAVSVYAIDLASNVLFRGQVRASRIDEGTVRHCVVRSDSRTPSRIHCVLSTVSHRPIFVSTTFGNTGYAELSRHNPKEILQGGANGEEIGAFGRFRDRLRENELNRALREFLPFPLEAQIVYED